MGKEVEEIREAGGWGEPVSKAALLDWMQTVSGQPVGAAERSARGEPPDGSATRGPPSSPFVGRGMGRGGEGPGARLQGTGRGDSSCRQGTFLKCLNEEGEQQPASVEGRLRVGTVRTGPVVVLEEVELSRCVTLGKSLTISASVSSLLKQEK